MTFAGLDSFATTIQKTNELTEDIEKDLNWEGRHNITYQAMRAVLHTLRGRMTVQETADFAAQLPMLVRGFFYEGWDPTRVPVKMNREEFVNEVSANLNSQGGVEPEKVIRVIMTNMAKHISAGELADVRNILPSEVASNMSL